MIDQALMQTVAEVLSGRPCLVRLRKPAVGSYGVTFHREGAEDVAVIDIDPGLDPRNMAWLHLHETAHAKYDLPDLRPVSREAFESRHVLPRAGSSTTEGDPSEIRADAIAWRWWNWAEAQVDRHAPGVTGEERAVLMLTVLKFWRE